MCDALKKVIEALETPGTRVRTALLLLPRSLLSRTADIAVQLMATEEDIVAHFLSTLPAGTRYANLSAQAVQQCLDAISQKRTGQLRALVVNVDLLLAGLEHEQRQQVWQFLRDSMPHRTRVLLVAMPEDARQLLPPLTEWREAGRCVCWG